MSPHTRLWLSEYRLRKSESVFVQHSTGSGIGNWILCFAWNEGLTSSLIAFESIALMKWTNDSGHFKGFLSEEDNFHAGNWSFCLIVKLSARSWFVVGSLHGEVIGTDCLYSHDWGVINGFDSVYSIEITDIDSCASTWERVIFRWLREITQVLDTYL